MGLIYAAKPPRIGNLRLEKAHRRSDVEMKMYG